MALQVGDLRLTHAATCYGVPHLQRHGQKEDRETKVAHVLYNTQTRDFALVVSKVSMFQTLGFRTSPICITVRISSLNHRRNHIYFSFISSPWMMFLRSCKLWRLVMQNQSAMVLRSLLCLFSQRNINVTIEEV